MGEIRKEHDREWFRPQFKVTFVWDYFDNDFQSHDVLYELLNVEGVNAERGTTHVKFSTPEERQAVRDMMAREIQNQFIDDAFIPYPRMSIIFPQPDEIISGTIVIQIEVLSLEMGEFTVEFRVDGGNWIACAYNDQNKYYEKSVNTNLIANGQHTIEIRAHDGLNVLLESGPFNMEVQN